MLVISYYSGSLAYCFSDEEQIIDFGLMNANGYSSKIKKITALTLQLEEYIKLNKEKGNDVERVIIIEDYYDTRMNINDKVQQQIMFSSIAE